MPKITTSVRVALLTCLMASRLRAGGPQIVGYQIGGSATILAPVSVTETSEGLRGSVGWQGTTCPVPGTDVSSRGVTTLRVLITPNDGGFVSFRYRFRTNGTMGYQGWTAYSDMGNNHFRARVVYGYPGSYAWETGSLREAFWREPNWPECNQYYDTQWMETSVYIYPGSGVELWLSVGSWGGYAAWVEFEHLRTLCSISSASATYAHDPRFLAFDAGDRLSPNRRLARQSIVATSGATPPCNGCCVSGLTPLDPADADSARMESGYDAWFWLSRCTTEIQNAAPCFKNQVESAGGTFQLSNTLRTAWYQRHFREVWDKYAALQKDQSEACATIKQAVKQEKRKHLLGFQPAGSVNPRHVNGEAMDVGKHHNLTDAQLLELAGACSLYRRVPTDIYHFEYQQQQQP